MTRRQFFKLCAAAATVLACRLTGIPEPAPEAPTPTPLATPPAATSAPPATATLPPPPTVAPESLPSATPPPTDEPTSTSQPTPTAQPSPTTQPTPTTQPSPTAQPTPTAQPSPTAQPTPTAQPSPTNQPTNQPTPTNEPVGGSPPLLIVDAHEDIAWNWLEFDRDPRLSALDSRLLEAGGDVPGLIGQRTTGLPQWLAGGVGLIFATLFAMPRRYAFAGRQKQVYTTAEEAHEIGRQQLAAYEALAAQEPRLRLVKTRADLEEVVAGWQAPQPQATAQVGLVLLMEGADPIRQPAEVSEWFDGGLRLVGPAWVSTRYAGGTHEPGPLTDLGRQLLQAMAASGMILDLSHIAEEAYLEAVDSYAGTVLASHSNPRRFLPTDRGLSDDMIRRLAGRGGVMGIVPFNSFLKPGWVTGDRRSEVTLDTVAAAIDHVVQLTGTVDHVALGSDFDGGFGLASIPEGMDTIADLQALAPVLVGWGYSAADVAQIFNGNWLLLLRDALPTGHSAAERRITRALSI